MNENQKWLEEVNFLTSIVEKTELEKTIKWGGPVYVYNGQNVLSIASFKAHVSLWFFNGVFLKDEHQVLENSQTEKTKAMRQWRFTSKDEMDENLILAYVMEAIQKAKEGKKHKPEKNKPLLLSEPLSTALEKNPNLKEAFEKLSLTKKREFAELISTAKRESTIKARLEKIKPMIMAGIGLNDKYR